MMASYFTKTWSISSTASSTWLNVGGFRSRDSSKSRQEGSVRNSLVDQAANAFFRPIDLDRVDWNAELVSGDLGSRSALKREWGQGLFVGGVKLPQALAELGLIDEYEIVVHPRLAGHRPTLFAGSSKRVDLKLVSRPRFASPVSTTPAPSGWATSA
jgi:hypothetical protein